MNGKCKYTHNLMVLCRLSKSELAQINKLEIQGASPYRANFRELLKSISPDPPERSKEENIQQYKERIKPIYPRYEPEFIIDKAGESIVVAAYDKERQEIVCIKFGIPMATLELERKLKQAQEQKKEHEEQSETEPKEKKGILVTAREFTENMFRAGIRNATDKRIQRQEREFETERTNRFLRGCEIQKQLHRASVKLGIQGAYIPAVIHINRPPKLYCIMEYIRGKNLIDWAKGKNDLEIEELFYKIIKFIEILFHRFSFIHSDIKPSNFLVLNDMPVFLDYGYAKNLNKDLDLTTEGVQLVTPLFSGESQYKNSKDRSYKDEIVPLARTLWCMIARSEGPDTSTILSYRDENGLVKYDPKQVSLLFSPEIFTDETLQAIFVKAHREDNEQYSDITLLRQDIERHLADKSKTCSGSCNGLALSQKSILKLKKMFDSQESRIDILENLLKQILVFCKNHGNEITERDNKNE